MDHSFTCAGWSICKSTSDIPSHNFRSLHFLISTADLSGIISRPVGHMHDIFTARVHSEGHCTLELPTPQNCYVIINYPAALPPHSCTQSSNIPSGKRTVLGCTSEFVAMRKDKSLLPIRLTVTHLTGVGEDSVFMGVIEVGGCHRTRLKNKSSCLPHCSQY